MDMQPRINKNQKVKSRKIYFSTKFKWCTPKIWFLRWCLSLKVLRQTSHEYGRLVLPQISFMCLCKLSCLVKKLQQFGHWKIFFKPTIKTKSNPNFGRIKLRVFEVSLFSFLTGCSPMGHSKRASLLWIEPQPVWGKKDTLSDICVLFWVDVVEMSFEVIFPFRLVGAHRAEETRQFTALVLLVSAQMGSVFVSFTTLIAFVLLI